jgi:hypothetical protein
MKKFLFILSCLVATNVLGYTWTVHNETKGDIEVTLSTMWGPNYTTTVPGTQIGSETQIGSIDVAGYCVTGIKAYGKSGEIKDKIGVLTDLPRSGSGLFIGDASCGSYSIRLRPGTTYISISII